ncbi:hypothetical protein ADK70_03940 [Streptomyces rimosus subsp. pseudoverticillatus]|uniref:hypothetical protein n=1 Tax=Streptomyces rimosus TaxID=1927 RepID=UPI0006B28065|nr:hypothetical protein [Streptomyces rimosus]KOT99370.1 hypothetical protein ADK70_03940 [Streptomyces rimosus subsp. pseudoverticillatus]
MLKKDALKNSGVRKIVPALLVALAAAGCGPAGSDEAGSAARPPLPKKNFVAADPATWTLPIEAYLPTDDDEQQVKKARTLLVGDCMKDLGFDWRPAPDLPKLGPKTLTDWRYGIHDAVLAKKRGYKPDAAEQAAYDRVMSQGAVEDTTEEGAEGKALNGGVAEVGGKAVPKGGCLGQANQKISDGALERTAKAQEIANDAFTRSKRESKVIKAFAAWSSCMKEHGYNYKEPLDASDDSRFSSPEVTKLEIATATADIACRDRTHVAKIWFDAESELQKQAIDKNIEELVEARKSLDDTIKKAARVLGGAK